MRVQRSASEAANWSTGGSLAEAWKQSGLCGQVDPELWFPEKGESTRAAKRVCAGCPVQARCLEYAIEHDERFGVWGGKSEQERKPMRRAAGVVAVSRAPRRPRPTAAFRSPLVDCPCGESMCRGRVAKATRNEHLRRKRAAA